MDLGAPASYLALVEGAPVYAVDGERIGRISEVVAAVEQDIFEGVVVATGHLPSRHHWVDAAQIDSIGERGVALTLDAAAVRDLPEHRGPD